MVWGLIKIAISAIFTMRAARKLAVQITRKAFGFSASFVEPVGSSELPPVSP